MHKKVISAIQELNQQYNQCTLDCFLNSGWKATTGNLIALYTGEDSEYYFEYKKWLNAHPVWMEYNDFMLSQQTKVKLLLAHTIQEVERRGIYKPPKKRIINAFPDWQTILAIIVAVFTGGYQTGVSFTQRLITKDQLKIEAELDSFKRGLKVGLPTVSPASKKADKEAQNQDGKEITKDSIHFQRNTPNLRLLPKTR